MTASDKDKANKFPSPHLFSTLPQLGTMSDEHSTKVRIKLQLHVPFNITKDFQPVRRSKKSPAVGDICTVVGWGYTENVCSIRCILCTSIYNIRIYMASCSSIQGAYKLIQYTPG